MYEFVGEPAIDAGGVAREFFQVLSNEIFNVNFGLFKYSNKNQICYTVNPASGAAASIFVASLLQHVSQHSRVRCVGIANSLHLAYFRFVGRIFGKALLEQHIISGHFTVPIYKHMLACVSIRYYCSFNVNWCLTTFLNSAGIQSTFPTLISSMKKSLETSVLFWS